MCDDRHRLLDYLYDECDANERRRVEQHLESCETCREELGGLRATRHDLLAWDVPEHGSVWKPFVPVRMAPRWRDVPAWAMAAAASLMFVAGAAGGMIAHALVTRDVPSASQAAIVPASTPVSSQPIRATAASASSDELSALQRSVQSLRGELASVHRVAVSNATARSMPTLGPQEISDRIAESETRTWTSGLVLNNRLAQFTTSTNARIDELSRKIEALAALIAQQSAK